LNSTRLAQRIGTRRIVGIDYNERMLLGALGRGIAAARCDVNKPLPFHEGAFTVVTALDVIEHIVETSTFTAELYRVIAPGGYLIIDTPNLASWHNVFALVLGIQPFSGPNITTMIDADLDIVRSMHRRAHQFEEGGEISDDSERELRRHLVVLAYRSALKLLRQQGFRIELGLGFGYLPFPPFLAGLLSRLDPAHSHHMVIKARKQA
jgi:SAM-dependent methyltransferase